MRSKTEKMMASVIAALVAGLSVPGCTAPALAGCAIMQGETSAVDEERMLEIARGLGWPSERIGSMERDGVGTRDANVLSHAAVMLDRLDAKYGATFKATEFSSPSFGSKMWRMRARASEGDYAGYEVSCRWLGGDEDQTDDLLSQVRKEDLKDMMWDVLHEVYDGTGAYAMCDVTVTKAQIGSEADLDTPVEELSKYAHPSAWVYVAHDTKLDANGYRDCATKLSNTLAERGINAGFFLRRLRTGPSGETITLDEAQSVVRDGKRGVEWDMAIVGTAKGWEELDD